MAFGDQFYYKNLILFLNQISPASQRVAFLFCFSFHNEDNDFNVFFKNIYLRDFKKVNVIHSQRAITSRSSTCPTFKVQFNGVETVPRKIIPFFSSKIDLRK